MMLEALDRLDARVAAGVLAEVALRLNHQWQVSPHGDLVENQPEIETAVLNELRRSLNLLPNDFSEQAKDLLTEALDSYSEQLMTSVDGAIDTSELNARGLVPSDTLELDFSDKFFSDFGEAAVVEKYIAELTVKRPDREERFLPPEGQSREVASIYSRYFRHKYPAREFWLLVVTYPLKNKSSVSDVWRLYPADLDLSRCKTLVDAMRVFSGKFGVPVDVDGVRESFFLSVRKNAVSAIARQVNTLRQTSIVYYKHNLSLSMFARTDPNSEFVHLLRIIDETRYYEAVSKRHGWDKNILSQLIIEDYRPRRIETSNET